MNCFPGERPGHQGRALAGAGNDERREGDRDHARTAFPEKLTPVPENARGIRRPGRASRGRHLLPGRADGAWARSACTPSPTLSAPAPPACRARLQPARSRCRGAARASCCPVSRHRSHAIPIRPEARDRAIEASPAIGPGAAARGRAPGGNGNHPCEPCFGLNGIGHRRARVRKPKANGFVERFNGAALDAFFRVKLRENFHDSAEALQADLDARAIHRNTERSQPGYRKLAKDPSKPSCRSFAEMVGWTDFRTYSNDWIGCLVRKAADSGGFDQIRNASR